MLNRGSLLLLTLATVVLGCDLKLNYKPKVKTYEIEAPRVGPIDSLKDITVCDKADQGITSEHLREEKIIHARKDLQDVEATDCDGTKGTIQGVPIEEFRHTLKLAAPKEIQNPVGFVDIENVRTCAERRLIFAEGKPTPDLNSKEWIEKPYWIFRYGSLMVNLNDSSFIFATGLPVMNGQNLLNIVYYGKCLVELDKNGYCAKGEELGRKQVLLSVAIETRELPGLRSVNICNKDQKN